MSPRSSNIDANATEEGWEIVVEPYGETWDFDTHPVLIGTYRGVKVVSLPDLNREGEMRDSNVYEVETADDGEKVSVWGGYTIDEAFAKIPPATVVKIEFHGKIKIKNGAQEVKQFTVKTKSA